MKASSGSTQNKNASAHHRQVAKANGLKYIDAFKRGIRRTGKAPKAKYSFDGGRKVTDADTLLRIKALVLPPAWNDVWICPASNGHIQAVGVDARGRKQYRYHAAWTAAQESSKYEKVLRFAHALPQIRKTVQRDLRRRGLPREKVLAAVIAVMEKTLIRVGNEEYATSNHSYGLTTLHDKHANIKGGKVHFEFKGKSGVAHSIDLDDRRLAAIISRCRDLPGVELFQYLGPDGKVHDVKSSDVNDYLRLISGEDFTAKDFRTWAGTFLAAQALREFEAFDSKTQAKRNVLRAIEAVARKLGNTKAVCRRCYIHPTVLDSYMDGALVKQMARRARGMLSEDTGKLTREEAMVVALLSRRLNQKSRAA